MILDEHFVPIHGLELGPYLDQGDINGTHHLIRYHWALAVLSNRRSIHRVLDVACGSGFGSFLIAEKLPQVQVIGMDYDPKAIAYARNAYSLSNLEFCCGDVTRLSDSIDGTIFDAILSFDTIEHVSHREIMMQNLIAHLKKRGVLLLSTPCGSETTILEPEWEHHKIEYSAASLYDFLKRYFKTVLRPDNLSLPNLEVFDQLGHHNIDYFLWMNPVICKNPITIKNPYAHVSHKRVAIYRRFTRVRAVWRSQGLRGLVRKTTRYIQRNVGKS